MKAQNEAESQVRHYYDENTGYFLSLGKDSNTRHIHQALYLKPDATLEEAMHASVNLVLEEIDRLPFSEGTVLDLGCGVGSSMFYLAKRLPEATFTGITISASQVEMGNKTIRKLGLGKRCQILQGSFQRLPKVMPPFDAAYAIEAFIHSPNAAVFFSEIAGKLKKGGRLVILDDFLSDDQIDLAYKDRKWVSAFLEGWQANSLYRPSDLIELAAANGFRCMRNDDFSDALKLARPRDYLIEVLIWLLGRIMADSIYMKFLKGGNARQKCHKRKLLSYRMLTFERQ